MVPLFTQALTEPLTLSVWPLSPASAFCWRRSPPRNAAEPRAGSHSSQPPLEQVRHRAHRATVRCCQYVFSQPPINQVRIPFNKRTHLIQLRGGSWSGGTISLRRPPPLGSGPFFPLGSGLSGRGLPRSQPTGHHEALVLGPPQQLT